MPQDEVPVKILTWWPRFLQPCFPFKSETSEGTVSYNPQPVMKQLGYDQSAITVTREMGGSNLLTTEAQFMEEGEEQTVLKYESIFWHDKARMGLALHVAQCTGRKFNVYILSKDTIELEVAKAMQSGVRNHSCATREM